MQRPQREATEFLTGLTMPSTKRPGGRGQAGLKIKNYATGIERELKEIKASHRGHGDRFRVRRITDKSHRLKIEGTRQIHHTEGGRAAGG